MKKVQAPGGLAGRWGDPQKHVAMDDQLFARMRQRFEALEKENATLAHELAHAFKCWGLCSDQLLQAQDMIRQLRDDLGVTQ